MNRIPRGKVATYGQIAGLAGIRGHARQVGYALHRFPEESDVPWHRVINGKGRISLPPGSMEKAAQRVLLEAEGVVFDADETVNLRKFQSRLKRDKSLLTVSKKEKTMIQKTATRRMFIILMIIAVITIPLVNRDANAQTAVRKTGAVLDSLTVIGHASVKIKTAQKQVIYIDPYQSGNYADSADVVLITHQHSDHNVLSLVKRKPSCTVITNTEALQAGSYKSFTIGGTTVEAVPAYNANHSKSACVGYVVGFNGIKLYHAGDTGNIPEMADLAAKKINYALLPMDGIFNMTPEEAVQAAASIKAAYVIPIHTMPPPATYSDAIVARFTAPNKLIVKNGQTIALQAVTSVGAVPAAPSDFGLGQNYPNPFNPATSLPYSVAPPSRIRLTIYNAKGEKVKTLVDAFKASGRHTAVWDGTDSNGMKLGTGVYVAELVTPSIRQCRRMVLVQ